MWVADLSYLRCWKGVVFFAFVVDAYSRPIVGWQLASHMRTTLVLDTLRMALGQRRPGADVALVHHRDSGAQPGLNRSCGIRSRADVVDGAVAQGDRGDRADAGKGHQPQGVGVAERVGRDYLVERGELAPTESICGRQAWTLRRSSSGSRSTRSDGHARPLAPNRSLVGGAQ